MPNLDISAKIIGSSLTILPFCIKVDLNSQDLIGKSLVSHGDVSDLGTKGIEMMFAGESIVVKVPFCTLIRLDCR